jgi:hypothetical protein
VTREAATATERKALITAGADSLAELWAAAGGRQLSASFLGSFAVLKDLGGNLRWSANGYHSVAFNVVEAYSFESYRLTLTAAEQLVNDCQTLCGATHSDPLVARSLLGSWRGLAGDPGGAVDEYELLLPLLKEHVGESHPSTLQARGNLAWGRGWISPRRGH